MESRKEEAVRLFKEGYNCSQAVFTAYADLYGIDKETALRLSSSFGAGIGRMREVCGTVSGMAMIAGMETGAVEGKDAKGKQHNYETVQMLAEEFRKRNGTIICRELLGIDKKDMVEAAALTGVKPQERTGEYYKKRPCVKLVEEAAEILEKTILKDRFKD